MKYLGMAFISVALLLASCTPIIDARGHDLTDEDFSQLIPGQSRAEDVQALFGSPSSSSTFGDTTWYYISERKETRGFYAPEVADQKVVAIHFDTDGYVKEVENFEKKDGRAVQIVGKETPTEGHSLGFLEQMLGNFGRFNTPGREINPRDLGR